MKRIITLLLVIVMVFGLVACGKPADSTDGTKPNDGPTVPKVTTPIRDDVSNVEVDTMKPSGDVADSNDEFINPEKFGGKTLQLYGASSVVYDDIDNLEDNHNFIWMMRAAVDEWAALNNVTIEFKGDFNANNILSAINAGERPDLVLMNANKFTDACNMGIAKPFTEEEYKAISDIIGEPLLNACKYKGQSHGLVLPWSGANWFRYNETMFQNYGAKTPLEYYNEGNWTWDTMVQCLEAVTKDFDGNGKIDKEDTYGSSTLGYMMEYYRFEEDDTGKVTSVVETSPYFKKYLEISYRGYNETLSTAGPSNQRCFIVTTPRPGTHIADTEWYNFHSMYQVNDLGEVIRALPMPVFSNEDPHRFNILTCQTTFMMSSCDEEEATLSLLCYLMKVGMRYMSDYSCGLYKCSYEGLRGASDFSKGYLVKLAEIIEERRVEFAAVPDWDQELYEKMVADVLKADAVTNKTYTGMKQLPNEKYTLPPASSLPIIAQSEKAWIEKYNSLYANID